MSLDQILVLLGGTAAIAWVNWYFFFARRTAGFASMNQAGTQEIQIAVAGGYTPQVVRVKAGQPVRLVFDRRETNPCSEEVVIPDFGIRRFLPPDAKTAVEFTPGAPGKHEFTCGMGMLHGTVIVE
jgi:plastocyanin domain-containing protein